MKLFRKPALLALAAVALGLALKLRADDSAFVPPIPEAAAAAGLLPPDKEIVGKKHSLLDRWTKAFGLTEEQRLWIEPQLHAEEGLTKPVLAYKALNNDERKKILLIIKLAARRQIRTLLTPGQQVLMDKEIESTKGAEVTLPRRESSSTR